MKTTGVLQIEVKIKEANYSAKEFYNELKEMIKDSYNCSVKLIKSEDIVFEGKNNLDGSEIIDCFNCGNEDIRAFDFIELNYDKEGKYEKYKCLLCGCVDKHRWFEPDGTPLKLYPSERKN